MKNCIQYRADAVDASDASDAVFRRTVLIDSPIRKDRRRNIDAAV